MREGWKLALLGDAVEISHGFAFPGAHFSEDPCLPTLVTPGNFKVGGGFQEAKPKTFDGKYPAEYEFTGGETVVTMTDLSKRGDTLGFSARIPHGGRFLHNQRVGLVKVTDRDALDPGFAYWLLQTSGYRAHVLGSATGSTVRHTSPKRILSFQFPRPPLDDQRRIAAVLGGLDDLIDTNQRLSADLYLFLAAETSKALSGATTTVPLTDVASFVNGKNFTKGATGDGLPVIRTPEVRNGPTPSTVRSSTESAPDNRASAGDILFVWSGSLLVDRWQWEEGLVNQHIFKVIPTDGYPAWLVYALIQHQMPWFLSLAADKATTMGHIQRKHLDAGVPALDRTEVDRLDSFLAPVWAQALASAQEADELRRVRDELLPLLMSGALTPGDVTVTS